MLQAAAQGALNQFAEQRATLAKVIEFAPWFSPAPFTLGASYLFNQPTDFAKAEQYYRRAISIAPGNDMYYWSLGDVYRGSNRLREARRYYKLALQLDPKDPTAPLKLGDVNSFRETSKKRARTTTAVSKRAGRRMPGSSRRSSRSPGVYAGEPAKAIQSLEKLVADIDGFGAGKTRC